MMLLLNQSPPVNLSVQFSKAKNPALAHTSNSWRQKTEILTQGKKSDLKARPPITTRTPATPAATPMIKSQTSDLRKVG